MKNVKIEKTLLYTVIRDLDGKVIKIIHHKDAMKYLWALCGEFVNPPSKTVLIEKIITDMTELYLGHIL